MARLFHETGNAMKVFISFEISGMEAFREATALAVRSLGHQVIRAEDLGAQMESPRISRLTGVR